MEEVIGSIPIRSTKQSFTATTDETYRVSDGSVVSEFTLEVLELIG